MGQLNYYSNPICHLRNLDDLWGSLFSRLYASFLYLRACFISAVLAALIFCLYNSVFELIVQLIC